MYNQMNKTFILLLLFLSGCGYQAQLMPRGSGTIYTGDIQGDGFGGGTATFDIGKKQCSGSYAKTASSNSFGFFQTYGAGKNSVSSFQSYSDNNYFKGLLSCSDGTGLRCDVAGGSYHGGGICVDSKGKVYDMIYSMK